MWMRTLTFASLPAASAAGGYSGATACSSLGGLVTTPVRFGGGAASGARTSSPRAGAWTAAITAIARTHRRMTKVYRLARRAPTSAGRSRGPPACEDRGRLPERRAKITIRQGPDHAGERAACPNIPRIAFSSASLRSDGRYLASNLLARHLDLCAARQERQHLAVVVGDREPQLGADLDVAAGVHDVEPGDREVDVARIKPPALRVAGVRCDRRFGPAQLFDQHALDDLGVRSCASSCRRCRASRRRDELTSRYRSACGSAGCGGRPTLARGALDIIIERRAWASASPPGAGATVRSPDT